MGNYLKNSRHPPYRPIKIDYVGSPVSTAFTPRRETCMSYRTRGEGQFVPDHIADPYAYFIRNSTETKREKAVLKYADRRVTPSTGFEVGPLPTDPYRRPESDMIRDNGHAFYKFDQSISTDRWAGPYKYRSFTFDQLFAYGCRVNLLNRARMPFLFSGTRDARYEFGITPEDTPVDARYYGQKAIGEVAPNSPEVNLAAILGELKEGLPSLPGILLLKDRAKALKQKPTKSGKSIGSEYLNIQFGLIPLLSDIRAVYDAVNNVSTKLAQYERDAGKGVRRRMSFPITKRREVFTPNDLEIQGTAFGIPPGYFLEKDMFASHSVGEYGYTRGTLTMNYTQKVWFTGSFTYFVPQGTSLAANVDKYRHMLERIFAPGMTVEALWQLAPWSWLVDWIFDLNASISSYQRLSDDSLVMNYGYVMATTSKVATLDLQILRHPQLPNEKLPVSSVRTTIKSVKKERVRANPYGFSVATPAGFTGKQWSIMAALGLSRM